MGSLICGGAGFIGSNLVEHLLAHGEDDVRVLDNESMGSRRWLPDDPRVEFVKGDFGDPDTVDAALRDRDTVIQLAADTRVIDSIANPERSFRVNVAETYALLAKAHRIGVERFVFASTGGAIVGEAEPPVDENTVARPISPYGASKLAIEGYLSAYAGSYGMKTCALRFSNAYGPRSIRKQSVVAAFCKRILAGEPLTVYGDGSAVRDFLFVGDLVAGLRRALEVGATGVFQLASARPTSVSELIAGFRTVVGASHPFEVVHEPARAGEVHTTWCRIDRAKREFGFDPGTPLEEGLAQTWKWFRDHGDMA